MEADAVKKGGSFLIEESEPASIFTPEDFSEEQRMFAKTTQDFVSNDVTPKVDDIESKKTEVTVELLRKAGELGLLMIDIPEKFGGLELDKATSMLVSEVMSWGGSFAVSYGVATGIGSLPIVYFGTDVQKEKYLPRLATAEILGCYALTEADSGSDALAAKAKAVLTDDGAHYVMNGEKLFVTNGGFSDIFIIFAQVNGEEFSAFIVEKDTPGVTVGAEENKLGIRGSSTVTIVLEDAKIPAENLLGEKGKGHKIAFNILNIGRFKLGVGCVGAAKQAFEASVKYAGERHQFKKPIASFGMIKTKLANMASQIFVIECMSYRTAGLIDTILASVDKSADDAAKKTIDGIEEYAIECSIMKVAGSEMLDYVVDEAVQVFGGYGFMADYPVERYYRDSRIARIYEGTNEINRLVIPGMMIRRAMKGTLALMPAAKKLQSELLEFASLDDELDESFMAEEERLVASAKKVALLAAGTAVQKYMDKIGDHQGILGNIADIIMEVYGVESAVLRTRKIAEARGEEGAAIAAKLTRLYLFEALGKIDLLARETLAASSAGDELRTLLAALRRFVKHVPIDTIALRDEITDYFVEKEKYEV